MENSTTSSFLSRSVGRGPSSESGEGEAKRAHRNLGERTPSWKIENVEIKRERVGKKSKNAEIAREQKRERNSGDDRAIVEQATAVVTRRKGTSAGESVCIDVGDKNS